MRIQTPPCKLLTTTTQLLLLGSICLYSVASFSFETAEKQTTSVTYLNTNIKAIDATINQCILAAPSTLFEISPVFHNDAATVYHIKQIVSEAEQKKLYATPIEEQIKQQKFISTKLCDGFASISDMNLPFSQYDGIQDANDGKLLIETTRHALAEILQNLEEMQNLAVSAANGTNGSADLLLMDTTYQQLIGKISNIANHTHFNDIYLLNGSRFDVAVPINNRKNFVSIRLTDALPSSLKIAGTTLISSRDASTAVEIVANVVEAIREQELVGLLHANDELIQATLIDETVTTFDIRNKQIQVKKAKRETHE